MLIKEFLAVEPNSVPLLELHGELYEEQGDLQSAVQHYGRAVEVLLKHPEPGMPTLHEEILDKIKSLAPDSPVVQKLTALVHGSPPADSVEPEPTASLSAPVQAAAPSAAGAKDEFSLTGAAPRRTSTRGSGRKTRSS